MRVLLVVYDNGSYIHWPPLGLMYIASVLRNAGVECCVWSQDLHHYPDSRLSQDCADFDAVLIGAIGGYYQHRKLINLCHAAKACTKPPFLVIGGHGPSPEPEYFQRMTGADAVVRGECEHTIADIVRAREPGIYREDNLPCVDSLPPPACDLFPMHYYRLLRMPHARPEDFVFPVLSGRGCPFSCNFCYRMHDGYRARSIDAIEDEVRTLQRDYGITYVAFADELLMAGEDRAADMASMLGTIGVRWECNGRLNYAKRSLLEHMRANGCVFINYGIESFDDEVLARMNKRLTCDQITRGVEATLAAGISPGLNIIWGNYGDTPETLGKGVDFLRRYDDGAQLRTIRPVTPYPGSPLYHEAIELGIIEDCEDFYAKHINSDLFSVNFMGMGNDEAHLHLMLANCSLLCNHSAMRLAKEETACRALYETKDATFRGFRQT